MNPVPTTAARYFLFLFKNVRTIPWFRFGGNSLGQLTFALLLVGTQLFGQEGVSSLSMGMARAGVFPDPASFRVEEIINYHRHQVAPPELSEEVAMELAGRMQGKRHVLQVALATARGTDDEAHPPLNLTFVIDTSGSMSGARLQKVQQSLRAFSENLREEDRVTLVRFSNSASVVVSGSRKTQIGNLLDAIDSLNAGGGTNLWAGLELGLQQAARHKIRDGSNRVLLLTDGMANGGVVDPIEIANRASEYLDQNIDLSCIGLGQNLNHELLRTLADRGRGLVHFVDDLADMHKIFVAEGASLLTPVAKDIRLTFKFPKSPKEVTMYGYDPKRNGQTWELELPDLNCQSTQVVLVETPATIPLNKIEVTLSYRQALSGEYTTQKQSWSPARLDSDSDTDLDKNYAIATVAQGIQQALIQLQDDDDQAALMTLQRAIAKGTKIYPKSKDADWRRVEKIASDLIARLPSVSTTADD